MGSQAQTYFCRNGHIVEDVHHHGLSRWFMDEENMVCPRCGLKELHKDIAMILEWHDPDYWDNEDTDAVVPHTPIKYEEETIQAKRPIYDVSKLFKEWDKRKRRK